MNTSVGFAMDQEVGGSRSLPISRVLVAEDYPEWRRQIRSLLQRRPEIEIVCEVEDGAQAVKKAVEVAPDLILMDIGLPGLNGMEACRQILRADPSSKILFLSQEKSSDVVQAAMNSGALGYVNKADAASELARAIDAVLQGRRFISSSLAFMRSKAGRVREHEVLFCFDDGAILNGLSCFTAEALSAGEPVIVVVRECHQKGLIEDLQRRGFDMKALAKQGLLVSLDADTPCSSDQFFQIVQRAVDRALEGAKTPRPIALCGERAGLLWAQGKIEEARELERLCTDLVASHNARILCIYPSPHLHDPLGLETVCEQHTGAHYF